MKRFFALCAFNIAALTAANLAGAPALYVIGAEVSAYLGWLAWTTYNSHGKRLLNQGVHMGWAFSGVVRDTENLRNTQMTRGNCVVELRWRQRDIWLNEPFPAGPFTDFVELERFLAQHPQA